MASNKIKDRTGERYGSLVVVREEGRVRFPTCTKVTWYCQCDCGGFIITRSSHLALGYVSTCGDRSVHTPAKKGTASPQYNSTHERIRKTLGSASGYACQADDDCDRTATQWAYDHSDENEVLTHGYAFSTDPAHYLALCSRHHTLMDNEHRRAASRA